MFEARLQVAFRGTPWEESVRAKRYLVLTQEHLVINLVYWTHAVSPRSKFKMSLIVCKEFMDDKVCPQLVNMINSRGIRVADLTLQLFQRGRRQESHGAMHISWRMGDGRVVDYLWPEGFPISVRVVGAWGPNPLRVKLRERRWILWLLESFIGEPMRNDSRRATKDFSKI